MTEHGSEPKEAKEVSAYGTSYHPATPQVVRDLLDNAMRVPRPRIRVHYGDRDTGLDWLEEHDVEGTVGRSMGPVKVPLLLYNSRSNGGAAMLDHCMVRVRIGGSDVYRHPKYHAPPIEFRYGDTPGFPAEVWVNGEVSRRFKSVDARRRWLRKMGLGIADEPDC